MMRHIIIGSSAVGISAMRKLRALDQAAEIICISDEQELPYNKCFLADYVGHKKTLEQVYTVTQDFCIANNITLLLGTRVQEIVPMHKKIICKNINSLHEQEFTYDTLLIGTGVTPIMPPIEGAQGVSGIFMFHRLRDATAITSYITDHAVKTAVVVGAGLSGLEAADALRTAYGLEVSVVDQQSRVLARQIDAAGSQFIEQKMHEAGIAWYPEERVRSMVAEHGVVTAVVLDSGTVLPADMVVVAVGARPNSQLAEKAGIALQGGAIITNDQLMTSQHDIYAAGDVALVRNHLDGNLVRSCTWPDAMMQGLVAATAMSGGTPTYAGVTIVTSSAFFGLKFAVCGAVAQVPSSYEILKKRTNEQYEMIIHQNGQIKGFVLVGSTRLLSQLKRIVLTQEITKIDELLA